MALPPMSVCHTILIMLDRRILVLDQLVIPSLIFIFIFITCLSDICEEKICLGHSRELRV